MINRINLILKAKNITARQFAEEIGIQPSGMSHILGGRNNPSLEFVSKVLRRYPEIDANWFLLGKGEMYSSQQIPANPPMQPVIPNVEKETKPLSELSLFDEAPVEPVENVIPEQTVTSQQSRKEDEIPPIPESNSSISEQPANKECRLERILFIYSDDTFKELIPRD